MFIHPHIIKKYLKLKNSEKKVIKTWSRSSVIIPEFMGITFLVHNGNKFIPVIIDDERKIGKLLGEFAPSKKSANHKQALRDKTKHKK